MLEAIIVLSKWLKEQNINPADVKIILSTDSITADRLANAIGRIRTELSNIHTMNEPVHNGTIYGIIFSVESKEP